MWGPVRTGFGEDSCCASSSYAFATVDKEASEHYLIKAFYDRQLPWNYYKSTSDASVC